MSSIICPICSLIRIDEGGKCWNCRVTYSEAIKMIEENEKKLKEFKDKE